MMDFGSTYSQEKRISNGPIQNVKPLPDGVLQVFLETGSVLNVFLAPHFSEARFYPLQDEAVWNQVDTNERFVHWYRDGIAAVELGWDELFCFALGPRWI